MWRSKWTWLSTIFFCFILKCRIAVVFLLTNATFADDDLSKRCPKRCKEDYTPMCCKNLDGETNMFLNECWVDYINCNQPENKRKFIGIEITWFISNFFTLNSVKCIVLYTIFLVYRRTDKKECPTYSSWVDASFKPRWKTERQFALSNTLGFSNFKLFSSMLCALVSLSKRNLVWHETFFLPLKIFFSSRINFFNLYIRTRLEIKIE